MSAPPCGSFFMTDGQKDEQNNEQTNERTNEQNNERTIGRQKRKTAPLHGALPYNVPLGQLVEAFAREQL